MRKAARITARIYMIFSIIGALTMFGYMFMLLNANDVANQIATTWKVEDPELLAKILPIVFGVIAGVFIVGAIIDIIIIAKTGYNATIKMGSGIVLGVLGILTGQLSGIFMLIWAITSNRAPRQDRPVEETPVFGNPNQPYQGEQETPLGNPNGGNGGNNEFGGGGETSGNEGFGGGSGGNDEFA